MFALIQHIHQLIFDKLRYILKRCSTVDEDQNIVNMSSITERTFKLLLV